MEKVRGHRGVGGLCLDPFALLVKMVPVKKHGREGCEETIRGLGLIELGGFRFEAAEGGTTGSQDIHRMSGGGQLFQSGLKRSGQAAEATKFFAIVLQFCSSG